MAQSFVATAAPANWKLGKWSQVNTTTWQEQKFDNPKVVYQFKVVSGPSAPGSSTVRLKMVDQNTEVLLLDSTALVFVNGSYFGEYAGEWQYEQGGSGGKQTGYKAVGGPSSAPMNNAPSNESQGPVSGKKSVAKRKRKPRLHVRRQGRASIRIDATKNFVATWKGRKQRYQYR
jgi:hypothetical protein